MALLSRTAILEAEDRVYEVVPVPEWGGEVRIRSITGRQRDAFEAGLVEQKGNDRKLNMRNARAKLIALCAVDEGGQPLVTTEDVRRLGSKNAKPLDRLYDACALLAGISEDDLKEMTENFDETPDDDSISDERRRWAALSVSCWTGATPGNSPSGRHTRGSPDLSAPNGWTRCSLNS